MSRFILAALFAAAAPAFAADLTINVEGVSSADGQVMVAIYNSAETFPTKPLRALTAPAHDGTVQLVAAELPAGEYAFALYHDANGNGKLDRNPVGMPIEDYAFSNNAIGKRGAPHFEDARIVLPAGGASTTVNLR
ncbi:DUF2141 domain-containing protein [Duganella radicis]|uniref:DUF2141 domain-containing protein n=1 Tax=Duganella radicis TaxID=551988 RepID=A0A6L6PC88_9BURK|nr:DUF2141 domain-containing protein [Duganella radicis]MTV36473.1 DUF2141 domain-containing protein [Duganella radicis]